MKVYALLAPRYAESVVEFDGCKPLRLIDIQCTETLCKVAWTAPLYDFPGNWKLSFLLKDFIVTDIVHAGRKSLSEGGRGGTVPSIRDQMRPTAIDACTGNGIYRIDADVVGRKELSNGGD